MADKQKPEAAPVDLERELHSAAGVVATTMGEIAEAEAGYQPIRARRIQIENSDRATFAQRRIEAMGAGQSPRDWDKKLSGLDAELKALDVKQGEIDDKIRELREVMGYASKRKQAALVSLCAVRKTSLADEINDLLVSLNPKLQEIEKIHRTLGMSVAPIIPAGSFNLLPSAKYPEPLTLKRD